MMNRREFIRNSALLAAAAEMPEIARASQQPVAAGLQAQAPAGDRLITSCPMLQNYAEDSVGVAFAVSAMANGYVTFGQKPDLSDGQTVKCGGLMVTGMNDQVMQVRLTGLKPSTRYYYRIGADRIQYKGGYSMRIVGSEQDDTVYSFTTAGPKSDAHFCVINDTHAQWRAFGPIVDKVLELAPQCVVWNGDATNSEETIASQKTIFLSPKIAHTDYAARIPYLFCAGNHDYRGMAGRQLERVWMKRQPEERASRDWQLGRNFAVRMGDVALIGLDTGEDKLDTNPLLAGLFASTPYREAQAAWLKDALRRKDIASAPFLVAFCHIPLFDPRPRENPGDLYPADKSPEYDSDFASWQRTCHQLWSPLLEKAGCQLVVTAHQHRFRYDAPDKAHGWAQLVGGGPDMEGPDEAYPTVLEGLVSEGRLLMRVHNIRTGKMEQEFTFAPRGRRRKS